MRGPHSRAEICSGVSLFRYNSSMAKHTKTREITRCCKECGIVYSTGSSIKIYCSPECRVRSAAKEFAGSDGCWEWSGSVNPRTGYGQLSHWEGGKRVLLTAHRVSFQAMRGDIHDGLHVLHKCDNKCCFNPSHLFLGTNKDNVDDFDSKGLRKPVKGRTPWSKLHPDLMPRGAAHHLAKDSSCLPRGVEHHKSVLTESAVLEIRSSTQTLTSLARHFGVSITSIRNVRLGKTWRHV